MVITHTKTYFYPGEYILGKFRPWTENEGFEFIQVANGRPFQLKRDDVVKYKGCTYDPKRRQTTRYFDFNGILLKSSYYYLQDYLARIG
jgi:hypothetical protein